MKLGRLIRQLILPPPFSVNSMRRASHKSAKDYKQWQEAACLSIMAQGPRILIPAPVFVEMIFPALSVSKQADTDNCAKCMLDAIVQMGILEDDNRMIAPMLLLRWHAERSTVVLIREFLGEVV